MLSRLAHEDVVPEPQRAASRDSRVSRRSTQGPATSDAALREAVEQALKPRARLLRLMPALERRYQDSTWEARSRGTRMWLAVIAVLDLIWIGLDVMIMPDQIVSSIVIRGVLIPVIFLGAAALLDRQRPAWGLGLAVLVTTIAFILANGYLAMLAGGVHAERLNTGALFVSFATMIVLPISFGFAIVQSVLSILIVDGLLVAGGHTLTNSMQLFVFFPVTILSALAAKRRFERMHRRIFLMRLHDELRVKDLAAANDQLTKLSHTDPLTGVFNRRYFDATLASAWRDAAAGSQWIGVMMVDVDHFKVLNDSAGHAEGDRCLQHIAAAIRNHMRVDLDLVARYGGEEFVVILPQATLETALLVAERVRAAVEDLRLPNAGLATGSVVTVSVGLAAVEADARTMSPERLLQAADIALYAAKATGRNYVCGNTGNDAVLISIADAPSLAGSV
jgi:diguanylate cyclase (GGDEF)-like protein